MAKRIKDTDYLSISTRIRAMEKTLLSTEQMEQILNADEEKKTEQLLQEYGYSELYAKDPATMDEVLNGMRESYLSDLKIGTPNLRFLDIFRLKYDYHNVKVMLKAEAMDANPSRMMMESGRISVKNLRSAIEKGELDNLPGFLSDAIREAKEVLSDTGDPQYGDMSLDRWMFRDMQNEAEITESTFLKKYVKRQIDVANLRTLVRGLRMGKQADFLQNAWFDGGSIDPQLLHDVAEDGGSRLKELYANTELKTAAEAGAATLQEGSFTAFEKACDDAVSMVLADAQMIPFGEAPLLAFVAAKEIEFANLRLLLLGRAAGLPSEVIRTFLRKACV